MTYTVSFLVSKLALISILPVQSQRSLSDRFKLHCQR